jgi:hypothetical protein
MVLVGYTQQLVLKGDSMHCCSCSKSVHQCCPCSKVQASNDNVCHDQCVTSHDDTTRFGATMHQLLCKILVIMQLAYKWSHSTKSLLWMSNINNLSKIKHNYIVWSLLLLLLSLITYSSLHHVTIVVAYFWHHYTNATIVRLILKSDSNIWLRVWTRYWKLTNKTSTSLRINYRPYLHGINFVDTH